MRAAIYNPYLDTLGGGERYSLSLAQVLAGRGYRVDVQWKDIQIKDKLAERFGLDLKQINIVPDIKKGDGYDVCFWVSDGSIPLLHARNNLLHFQFPFKDIKGKTLLNKMKLFRINKIICNSVFTKKFIDAEFGIKSLVIYPPVDVKRFKAKRKENLILYVGRFSQLTQAKRQDILIKVFKKFFDDGHPDWKMILAGGTEVGAGKFVDNLKKLAVGYPVRIVESPKFSELQDFYGRAKFFWSAAGYGIDADKEPIKVEHFGMTVVESMAAGCIPLVFKAGGYPEIINQGLNGFLWEKEGELVKYMKELINKKFSQTEIAWQARKDSENYAYEKFTSEINKIIQ